MSKKRVIIQKSIVPQIFSKIDLPPCSYRNLYNGIIRWNQMTVIMDKEPTKSMTGLPMTLTKIFKLKCIIKRVAVKNDLVLLIPLVWLLIKVATRMNMLIKSGGKMLIPITGSRKMNKLLTKDHWKELRQAKWNNKK